MAHSNRYAYHRLSRSLSENWLVATVRHSGMLLAGIQIRATAELPCGWIPAKSMPE
jgi:hypothetical protein